jgi:hypothetical protein
MSVESDEVLEIIKTAMSEPLKVAGDAGSYENQSVSSLIEAHRYLSELDPQILAAPQRAIRFAKLRPPGAV